MISVIIPAYNEEKVIARCLKGLDDQEARLDVIVVCNGCTDNTAQVATKASSSASIISIDMASKTNAINIGLKHCRFKKILLLDADIFLTFENLMKLSVIAEKSDCLVASPLANVELARTSFMVKHYYLVALKLPYFQKYKISAAILLNEIGIERLGMIPNVISDDNYISLQFKENEKAVIKTIQYTLTPPENFWSLIKILTRSELGNLELKMKYPNFLGEKEHTHARDLILMLLNLRLFPSLAIFILTKLVVKIRARGQLKGLESYLWEKDNSSRRL